MLGQLSSHVISSALEAHGAMSEYDVIIAFAKSSTRAVDSI